MTQGYISKLFALSNTLHCELISTSAQRYVRMTDFDWVQWSSGWSVAVIAGLSKPWPDLLCHDAESSMLVDLEVIGNPIIQLYCTTCYVIGPWPHLIREHIKLSNVIPRRSQSWQRWTTVISCSWGRDTAQYRYRIPRSMPTRSLAGMAYILRSGKLLRLHHYDAGFDMTSLRVLYLSRLLHI